MTIENECLKLETTTKKITQAKENINTEITNLGGNAVKTISEVPKELDNTIKNNFGKIGIFSSSWSVGISTYNSGGTFKVPLNIPKEYTRFFVTFDAYNRNDNKHLYVTCYSGMPSNNGLQSTFMGDYDFTGPSTSFSNINNEYLNITIGTGSVRDYAVTVKQIIAIK